MFYWGIALGLLATWPLLMLEIGALRAVARFHRPPGWLFAMAVIWGALVATSASALLGEGLEAVVVATAGQARAAFSERWSAVVQAPVVEEGVKFLGLLVLAKFARRIPGAQVTPLGGLLLGAAVGFGFTLTEDALYAARHYVAVGPWGLWDMYQLRSLELGPSHASFSAWGGLAVGYALQYQQRWKRLLVYHAGMMFACMMHALHNALPVTLGEVGATAMVVLLWVTVLGLAVIAVVLLAAERRVVLAELGRARDLGLTAAEIAAVASYFSYEFTTAKMYFTHSPGLARSRRSRRARLIATALERGMPQYGPTALSGALRAGAAPAFEGSTPGDRS